MLDAILQLARDVWFFAGYVRGGNAFPPPLEPQEEKALLQRLTQGDQAARNLLIEHNLRLVAHIAKKYSAPRRDPDDLISIGTVGLIKAVSTFKPDKGNTLATYAARCIENAILSQRLSLHSMRWITHAQRTNGMYFGNSRNAWQL